MKRLELNMFKFSLKIVFSVLLFASTWSFIDSQETQCSDVIYRLKLEEFGPTKIYSRSTQFNLTFTGETASVYNFDLYISYDNVRRIICDPKSFVRLNSTSVRLGCLTNSSQIFSNYGTKLNAVLFFHCSWLHISQGDSQIYNKRLPQLNLTLVDPLVLDIEPKTLIKGHRCTYRVLYAEYDTQVDFPTPVQFGLKNGTRCIKRQSYSKNPEEYFTCLLDGGPVGSKFNFSLFIRRFYWQNFEVTIDAKPTVLRAEGSTFTDALIPIIFKGANLQAFRSAAITVEDTFNLNYCSVRDSTTMECACCYSMKSVDKPTQVEIRFWSHDNRMETDEQPIKIEQNPAPNRETIKSHIKENVLTISIDHYKSHYIPWTVIEVYDDYLKQTIECKNITISADSNVTCILDRIVSSSAQNHRLMIKIGSWNANKLYTPEARMDDLFFFKVIISFVFGLLLIYICLYFIVRYKFKKPFNVYQVAFLVGYCVTAIRSKMTDSGQKSIILSKKSFTSLGRSRGSLESKSKSNLDKRTSKSLPKLPLSKNLKGILKHKSELQSMQSDVRSLITKSNASGLIMESKSSSGEKNILKGKSKIFPRTPSKVKAKTPTRASSSSKSSNIKTKSKPSLKFKQAKL